MNSQTNTVTFLKFPGGFLRPLEMSDAPLFYKWVNDPELRHYFGRAILEHIEEEEEWIKKLAMRKHNNMVWMLVLDDGTIVGSMGLHGINWINRTATTGSMFGNKDCHNKGIGKKAKMVLLDYVFNILGLRQIYSEVISYNHRSRVYSEQCGYVHVATLPKDVFWAGQYFDRLTLMVTKETWQPIWEVFCQEHQIESFSQMLERQGNQPRK